jgi:biopolymer transport protein ExbD
MKFQRNRRGPQSPSIDITPVVDVVFILLIFLVISTTFKTQEHAFQVDLPKATQPRVVGKLSRPTVFVSKEGKMMLYRPNLVGTATLSGPDELADRLRQLKALEPSVSVGIRADAGVPYQVVMDAVNACYSAGIERVVFPYSRKEEAY